MQCARAATAALRHSEWSDEVKFVDYETNFTWIKLEALYLSRRRFHMEMSLEAFMDGLRTDLDRGRPRFAFYEDDDCIWIRSPPKGERRNR